MKALLAAVAALSIVSLAHGADYPSKPIVMVVAYPPGGGMDVMGRMLAGPLGKRLNQQIVIENRGGASGMIGSEYVARATADGHIVIFAPADTHSINPHVYTNIRYDALRDFEPIGMVGSFPMALVANPKLEIKTVEDFRRNALAKPGKMSYASWGLGSSSHVFMQVVLANGKLDLLHVPYTGAAPAIAAVISGSVDTMMVTLPTAEPYHLGGKIRIAGVTPTRRPDGAPSYSTEGMPTELSLWAGLLAPAKTPRDVVDRLNRELASAMQEPELRASLEKAGLEPTAKVGPPDEFRRFLGAQSDSWGKTVRAANISMEFK